MANDKKAQKDDKCTCGEKCKCKHCTGTANAFPICFLACVLTAVIVTITFATSFTLIFKYELRHKYGSMFFGQFDEDFSETDENEMTEVKAGALIDFFESGHTGFVFATSDECTRCGIFSERLLGAAEEEDLLSSIVHYNYPANNNPNKYDLYAETITLNGEEAPVLLYVRNGKIYDRLDDVNSESGIVTFLEKYK